MRESSDCGMGPHELLDSVELTAVGVDIGSATSQLMFSQLRLRREAQRLSSRFVVVDRRPLWRSPVRLTPYRDEGWIDAAEISAFVRESYSAAQMTAEDVDTGAIILTGEALKKQNARALAEAVAGDSGEFVCVSAGHDLEAVLSAHGSGSVELSRATGGTLLCVDIGGGTTKLSLIRAGEIVATGAFAVGGRMVFWDADRRVRWIGAGARFLGPIGSSLAVGDRLSEAEEEALAREAVARILAVPHGQPHQLDAALMLTSAPVDRMVNADAVTFSGGVAEYIYGRESQGFDDLGRAIGVQIRDAVDIGSLPIPVLTPGAGIRSTVVGAAQHSVQVSGSTVTVADPAALPLRNLPVLHPEARLSGEIGVGDAAARIREAMSGGNCADGAPLALAFHFEGAPSYQRVRALSEAIGRALDGCGVAPDPLVIMLDRDLGRSLGAILAEETGVACSIICLDNIELSPMDHVDIGRPLLPAGVFPVVIKSLLFAREVESHQPHESQGGTVSQ